MSDEVIVAEKKPENLRAKQIRKTLGVPFVVYGKDLKENKVGVILTEDMRRVIASYNKNTILHIEIDGEKVSSLVKEIQKDAVSMKPLHIDFLHVRVDSEVETDVSIKLIGSAPASKSTDLSMIFMKDSVNVKCRADSIPEFIELDVSEISTVEDTIFVKDLKVAKGIEIQDDPEDVVISVTDVVEEVEESEEEKSILDEIAAEEEEKAEGESKDHKSE